MAKIMKSSLELNQIKLKVIENIVKMVSTTLGPSGKPVLLDLGYGSPKMTKDGVTVARNIEFQDAVENTIASFFKTAASHTVDQAGDGTTTSIVLAGAIYQQAMKGVAYNLNTVHIKEGIEKAANLAIKAIDELKVVVSDDIKKIEQVAIVSANGDQKVGKLIANAFEKIGINGVITVEEGKARDHDLKIVMGMQFDKGYISPYFATNTDKMVAELENCMILIYDKKISSIQSMLNLLKMIHEKGKSLLIIAEDVDGDALSGMLLNKMRGVLQVVAVKAPGFGDNRKEILQDIAYLTGAQVISEDAGFKLESVTFDQLGQAKRVVVNANETIIVDGNKVKEVVFNARIDQIKEKIAKATSDYEKEQLEQRLAKLVSGIAIIKVGGLTEELAKECKDRVDDAVQAVKAAISEGIVPGGTVTLLHACEVLEAEYKKLTCEAEKIGFKAVIEALKTPLKIILENAGRSDYVLVYETIMKERKKDKNFGLDVRSNVYGDLIKQGIVDPVKVIRCAINNASATASMLVVSDALIANVPDKEKDGGSNGHGMGMY